MDTKPNTNTVDSKVIELTGQTDGGAAIDFHRDSYEDIQRFSYDLFRQNIDGKNPVLSPVSAYLALSMAGCGADGTTRDEFYNVLGQQDDMEEISGNIMNTFPADGEWMKLSIANSAWIDDEFIVDEKWLGMVKSLMKAEAFQADLSTVQAMDRMNSWVRDKTNGLIDSMIDKPLDDLSRFVLFNTVYFKGRWKTEFEFENTHEELFTLNHETETTVKTNMMNLYRKNLEYIANDFAEGVILPYQKNNYTNIMNLYRKNLEYIANDFAERGDSAISENNYDNEEEKTLAFIGLKPTGNHDIREVCSKLTCEVVRDILAGKKTMLVSVKLPKFEVSFDRSLEESLINMGLKDCFDMGKANFGHMGKTISGDNLSISQVRQKAKVIVDERGTEAAAATVIDMMLGSAWMELEEPKKVYFDEPFIYMIMEMEHEIPLFIGIMDNPPSPAMETEHEIPQFFGMMDDNLPSYMGFEEVLNPLEPKNNPTVPAGFCPFEPIRK